MGLFASFAQRDGQFPHGAVALVEYTSCAQLGTTRAAPPIPNMLVRKRTHDTPSKVVM